MKLLRSIREFFARSFSPVATKRSYAGAAVNRMTADWLTGTTSADAEIYRDLQMARNRSRDMERNNPYVRRFLAACVSNVVGHTGVTLQSRILNPDGTPDDLANDRVEAGWADWSLAKNCTVTGKMTRRALEALVMRTVARDGEIFIRIVEPFPNEWGIALQLLEGDLVDHTYNVAPGTGRNEIRMGVELDAWQRPVAYWTWERHPGDFFGSAYRVGNRERIPAEEMLHLFLPDRPGQTRCMPWIMAAMVALRQLNAYEDAEVTAARVAACKMGFYTRPQMEGREWDGAVDGKGDFIDEAEPGSFDDLPYGVDFKAFDPTHPNGNFPDFRKAMLRGAASGLNMGYNSLAMDLEGVNYSSLRAGKLDENDAWLSLQAWFIESLHEPIFPRVLERGLDFGRINLPPSKLSKFNAAEFIGRRWPWVDPEKDQKAQQIALQMCTTSRTRLLAEQGIDFEDVLRDRQTEEKLAKKYGVKLEAAAPPAPTATATATTEKPAKEEEPASED